MELLREYKKIKSVISPPGSPSIPVKKCDFHTKTEINRPLDADGFC